MNDILHEYFWSLLADLNVLHFVNHVTKTQSHDWPILLSHHTILNSLHVCSVLPSKQPLKFFLMNMNCKTTTGGLNMNSIHSPPFFAVVLEIIALFTGSELSPIKWSNLLPLLALKSVKVTGITQTEPVSHHWHLT